MAVSRGKQRAMRSGGVLLLLAALIGAGGLFGARHAPPAMAPINLAHLDSLVEPLTIAGQPLAIVHIYSEYPEYQWVDASGEGIACVDDTARAVLVYLASYARFRRPQDLQQARLLLRFVLYMQAADGEYYNFVLDRTGGRNETGPTSFKSWGWWAARGQYALAAGYGAFRAVDPAFAAALQAAYQRGEAALSRQITHYGRWESLHGERVPGWLLNNGSDLTALAMLGLAEYYAVTPEPRTAELLGHLGEAVAAYQLGNFQTYPFGAFPSAATSTALWHAWGSHQVEALVAAGTLLHRPEWVLAARQAADDFYVQLLAGEMISEMGVQPVLPGQIAYGVGVVSRGLYRLYQATGDIRYAHYAGLAGSWFFGNNMAGFAMYDPTTGRGFDGIRGANDLMVNRNAGAESTVEALLTLLPLTADPLASRYLHLRPLSANAELRLPVVAAEAVAGKPEYGRRDSTGEARFSNGHYYALAPGDAVDLNFTLGAAADYYVYLAHLRQSAPPPPLALSSLRTPAPPALDGDPTDFAAAPAIAVDQADNVLRGGAGWGGKAQDSFVLRSLWDENNLYISAVVQGQHHQSETGAEVWKGSALWLYLDLAGDGSRVGAKLTLAQTPKGPQVWEWRSGFFLPGARLAWREVPGGYAYTAALPWASLGDLRPTPGRRLGLEAGIGISGGGFMDITGRDPDAPSNLAPLALVMTAPPAVATTRPGQAQFDVATAIELDGTALPLLGEATSPDRDYLWLDRVTPLPVQLAAGEHHLRFTGACRDSARRSVLDAVRLVPVEQRKRLAQPDGLSVELIHRWDTGENIWKEPG